MSYKDAMHNSMYWLMRRLADECRDYCGKQDWPPDVTVDEIEEWMIEHQITEIVDVAINNYLTYGASEILLDELQEDRARHEPNQPARPVDV